MVLVPVEGEEGVSGPDVGWSHLFIYNPETFMDFDEEKLCVKIWNVSWDGKLAFIFCNYHFICQNLTNRNYEGKN